MFASRIRFWVWVWILCCSGYVAPALGASISSADSEGMLWSHGAAVDLQTPRPLHPSYQPRSHFNSRRQGDVPVMATSSKIERQALPRTWSREEEWEDIDELQEHYDRERELDPDQRQTLYRKVLAAVPHTLSIGYPAWQPVGGGIYPDALSAAYAMSGRVSAAQYAYDEAQAMTVLWAAGAGGGLWKAQRIGSSESWVPVSSTLPDPTVGAFLVDRTDSRHLLIGTGNQGRSVGSGLYRSLNAGADWAPMAMTPTPSAFYKILQDRNNAGVILAATDRGLYRSETNGLTWAQIYSGDVTDLAQDPQTFQFWYAAARGVGVLESNNYGAAFHPIAGDGGLGEGLSAPIGRMALAVCESAPNYVYAIVGNDLNQLGGVYRSADYGYHWTPIRSEDHISLSAASHVMAIAVHPDNPDRVAIGIYAAEWSNDATSRTPSWSQLDGGHSDYTSLMFVPAAVSPGTTTLIATNDGGIFLVDYMSGHLDDRMNTAGLNIEEQPERAAGMSGSRSEPNVLLAGLQDNGIVQIDRVAAQPVFARFPNVDGGQTSISPDDADQLYFSIGTPYTRIYSPDRGASWTALFDATNEEAPPLVVDPRPGLAAPKLFTYFTASSASVYARENLNRTPLSTNEALTITVNLSTITVQLYAGDNTVTAVNRIRTALNSAGLDSAVHVDPGAGYFGIGGYERGGDQSIRVVSNLSAGPGTTGFGTTGLSSMGRFGGLWYKPAATTAMDWLPVGVDGALAREVSAHTFVEKATNPFYDVLYVTGIDGDLLVYDSQYAGPIGAMLGHEIRTPALATRTSMVDDARVYADRSTRQWDTVYFSTGARRPSQAFLSLDRGVSWSDVTGNLPELAPDADYNQLVANPNRLDELFLATSLGVFYSGDRGLTWEPFNQGLPAITRVQSLVLQSDNTAEPRLYIGTKGQGFWSRSISDVLFANGYE